MNRNEIVALLGLIAARDRRTVGEADVQVWGEDLDDVAFEDARAAVRVHFREKPGVWCTSGHIYAAAREIRRERAMRRDKVALSDGPSTPEGRKEAMRLFRELVARTKVPSGDSPHPDPVRGSTAVQDAGNGGAE